MIAQQPLDKLPNLKDADMHGGWCNKGVKGGTDYGPDGYDMARVGLSSDERVGMKFDGAGDYLRRAVANWRNGDSQGTISAWIKLSGNGTFRTIFISADELGNVNYFSFRISNDNVVQAIQRNNDTTDSIIGSTVLHIGIWYRVTLVSTGTEYIMYVNGEVETLSVLAGANTGDWLADTTSRDNIAIGARRMGGPVNYYFNGSIKDVQYHSRPLTASEIMHDYRAGVPDDSLKLHLHKHRYDLSRYAAEFDNVGGVVLGHEMEFDGTNYLKRTVADWRTDSQGTISAWVKRNTYGVDGGIFSSSDEGSNNKYFLLRIQSNRISLLQRDGGGTNSFRGSTLLLADQWNHLVLISTGDAYAFYVNGQLETFTLASGTAGPWIGNTSLRDNVMIGAREINVVDNIFDGTIKDLHYHSEPKSVDWVKVEYDKTKIFY